MADTHGQKGKGWIGVDLDGTLAHYDGWKGVNHIGAPVPKMLSRVKQWLADGKDVRIVTARVAPVSGQDREEAKDYIKTWLKRYVGQVLPVTHQKDQTMIELWDDRCIQVVPNTGERVDGKVDDDADALLDKP